MSLNSRVATFASTEEDYNVIASNEVCATFFKTLDINYLQPDSNGSKYVKPGSLYSSIVGSNLIRVLPLTLMAAALAASGTALTVADAKIFALGEPLVVARPFATLTFAGTPATGNTVSLIVQGQTLTYTLLAGDNTASLAATSFAAFINAGAFRGRIAAIASGAIVYFYSKAGFPYTFATAVTGGGITSTASAATMQENVVIGSIHASTPINATTNVITLAAGSAIALPIGMPIGVPTPITDILGMAAYRVFADSTQKLLNVKKQDVGIFTVADIYTSLVPYWDEAIASQLRRITSVPR
jgi:hypothetical protein